MKKEIKLRCEGVIMGKTLTTKTLKGRKEIVKLEMICAALDKNIEVFGKKVNLLDEVRYGIYGATMREIQQRLEGK